MSNIFLSEQELILQSAVREFADKDLAPRARQIDNTREFPWQNFKDIARMGLFSLATDTAYGGTGGGFKELGIVIEEIARACAATSVIYAAHISLATQAISRFGNEEQKQRFIPPLVKGEKVGAFALSESESGSDAGALRSTVTRQDDCYILNGSKMFITNGDVADTLVVFATHERSLGSRGIDCFILEKGMAGLTANKLSDKMGMRASSTVELVFQDCVVPEKNRLGDEGTGFYIAMEVLESSRVGIAAQCVGIGQACLDASTRYARSRQAFGKPIADFQAIQWMIADMATDLDAARLLTRRAAILKDMNASHGTEASMAKLFASEAANRAASKALQIHGGYGYFNDSPVERYYRDAKVTEIYEGTSEIQRLVIARSILGALT